MVADVVYSRLRLGLTEKEETSQINILIYTMGDKAEDILTSLKLTEAQKKKYDVVKQKFEEYFVKRHNPIFKRARTSISTSRKKVTLLIASLQHFTA